MAYGGEIPKPDGTREFKLMPLGAAIIKALGREYLFRYGRSEFNKNAVMNLGTRLEEIRGYNVPEEWLIATKEKMDFMVKQEASNARQIAQEVTDQFKINNPIAS